MSLRQSNIVFKLFHILPLHLFLHSEEVLRLALPGAIIWATFCVKNLIIFDRICNRIALYTSKIDTKPFMILKQLFNSSCMKIHSHFNNHESSQTIYETGQGFSFHTFHFRKVPWGTTTMVWKEVSENRFFLIWTRFSSISSDWCVAWTLFFCMNLIFFERKDMILNNLPNILNMVIRQIKSFLRTFETKTLTSKIRILVVDFSKIHTCLRFLPYNLFDASYHFNFSLSVKIWP